MTAAQRSPRPDAERRGVLRHAVEVEGVLSLAADTPVKVLLTDISEHGCQIVRPPEVVGGEAMALSFAGFAPFHATVVWTSAEAAGLRFEYRAHAALIAQVVAAANGRRRGKRLLAPDLVRRAERERLWHLRLPVRFRIGAATGAAIPLDGVLSDLSTEGCRITAKVSPLPGAEIAIVLDGRPALAGQVRWVVDRAIGVRFAEPLSPAAVQDIAQR